MGSSAAEIERQITETREHLDANLRVLERRAAKGARKAARVAAIGVVGVASAAAVGYAVYTLARHRSPAAVVRDAVPRSIRHLPRKVAKVLKHRPAKVKVVAAGSDAPRGQSSWRTIAEKVATAVAVSIAGALASRIIKPGGRSDPSRPQ
ncbi:MAG: hypothetical protein E6I73_05840 [Chloroflexi bacterium]|nr:MAG: hypothetical protein E6I73_05840 [Chloroflexota bacterium]